MLRGEGSAIQCGNASHFIGEGQSRKRALPTLLKKFCLSLSRSVVYLLHLAGVTAEGGPVTVLAPTKT
jgi:hypothetical protein